MKIETFDDWKAVMGTGFRLTKDQKTRGISREAALVERVALLWGPDLPHSGLKVPMPAVKPSKSKKGDILIRIRPEQGVDPDYFKQLAGKQIEVVLDEKWYSWLDDKLDTPYNRDIDLLMRHILNLGMGEVICRYSFESDFES